MSSSAVVISELHLYTQRLNNSAALCIEIGRFDRAIISLEKALQLLKLSKLQLHHRTNDNINNDNDKGKEVEEEDDAAFLLLSDKDCNDYCQCHQCSKDGCIIYSETTSPKISDAHYANNSSLSSLNTSDNSSRTNKKRRVSTMSSSTPTTYLIDQQQLHHKRSSCSSLHGYIYKHPIRITPKTILEGHTIDYSTMYCIITFNLALANHLPASCVSASAA